MNVKRKVPWEQIKREYLLGASQRSLAIKYDVARGTVASRASAENWPRTREQIEKGEISIEDVQPSLNAQEAVSALSGKDIPTITFNERRMCQEIVKELILKIYKCVQVTPAEDARTMRDVSMILKDLKELGVFRPELDIKEQEARIAKLEKEADTEVKDNVVNVVIEPELEQFTG